MKKKTFDEYRLPVIEENNILVSTLNGNIKGTNERVSSPCPSEFQNADNATMKWLKMDFDKPYDLLLGNDFIFKNVKIIDKEKEEIGILNGVKIAFFSKTIQEQVYALESGKLQIYTT